MSEELAMDGKSEMGLKRLLLELLAALLLARFAMAIGGVQSQEAPCAQGLPALAAEVTISEHESGARCTVAPGASSETGGTDGTRR